jgi:aldehyde:ferredoxin oxidoreductase
MSVTERGYAGKILHLKLSTLDFEVIPTEKYVEWGGGNGLATALYWDFCEDKTIRDGRDEKNVVVFATSPLCGTAAPSAGGRCEIVGTACGLYPESFFSRSNIGGRLSAHMKFAGWDAIVISGKAPEPVWVEIQNSLVRYHSAKGLWGKDAHETQIRLFGVLDRKSEGWGWQPLPGKGADDSGYTTQRPAIAAISQAGERLQTMAGILHDAGNVSGQGGFGAVWGSKNLKAISVLGTGSVKAADPAALIRARFKVKERYAPDVHNPDLGAWSFLSYPKPIAFAGDYDQSRRSACVGCIMGCRQRFATGVGNELKCQASAWYLPYVKKYVKKHPGEIAVDDQKQIIEISNYAADLCNRYAINTYLFQSALPWLEGLWHSGLLGKGKQVPTELDFDKLGTKEFVKDFCEAFALRKDIGELFGDGFVQGAIGLGLEEDYKNGTLDFPYWGIQEHGYDPRAEVEWGYASILTDRDINSHEFNQLYWNISVDTLKGNTPRISAEKIAHLIAEKLKPYVEGPECMDFSEENIYSDAVMNLTRWYIHYNRFWKNSALFCDLRWANLFHSRGSDSNEGATGDEEVGEQVYWNAVTGENIGIVDGLKRGHRIIVLQNAIWALQGRHRDKVHFADFIYEKPYEKGEFPFYMWTVRDKEGTWRYADIMHRKLDREKFEDFKTRYYLAEGLDPKTGWPTEETLRKLKLDFAIEELKRHGKLPTRDAS